MARIWLLVAVLALALAAAAQADDCTVNMPRLANVFYTDEPVRMTVVLPAPRRTLTYEVTDYAGALRYRGSVGVGGVQPVTLSMPSPPGPGFYRLSLRWDTGTRQEVFCVLPRPYEDPGDYRLFGMCPGDGSNDEILQLAAQVGVRIIRQSFPWPPIEPQRGVWRPEVMEGLYDYASRHGVQMMGIFGYTPTFLAEKPANAYNDAWANAAMFTWHPKDSNEYGLYLDRVTDYTRGKMIRWPPPEVMPTTGRPTQQTLPWVNSWEMWNEADLCFYMGDWNRYLDLLHMSWAAGRRSVPDAPMVYGGSTGNWTAMCITASGSARYCFDFVGLHTGGDLEESLRVWYGGAQQIPWCVGAPRETAHTECYAQGRRNGVDYPIYQETPGQLQRIYLTLKAWREVYYFRSGCLGGIIGKKGVWAPGTAMVWSEEGKITPTPLYPAFAGTRRLLSDAVEVGPVNLGANVTAHLFLKHGVPMLAAWSDDRAFATVSVKPTAKRVDPFGRLTNTNGQTTYTARLGIEPLVLLDVSDTKYLPEALGNRFRLLTQSAYGTPQVNTKNWCWYVNPMQQELQELLGASAFDRLNTALQRAQDDFANAPDRAPASLLAAQEICFQIICNLILKCPPGQEMPVKVANNIWRLAHMEEWLGEVADDRSGLWNNLTVPLGQVQWVGNWLTSVRQGLRARHPDSQLPVADQLLDRCRWNLWRLNQYQRRGTYNALVHKGWTAVRLNYLEKGVVMRVVPLLDFPTGQSFRKARMLEPARTHPVSVWVYNYLDHDVSGTLQLKLPAGWSPQDPRVPFGAEAGRPSEIVTVPLTLTDSPTPWIQAVTFTMDQMLNVSLPSSLTDRPIIEVSGVLDSGEPLSTMAYFLNVGRWLDAPTAASSSMAAAQLGGSSDLQLPPAVKAAQVRAVAQELARMEQWPRRASN